MHSDSACILLCCVTCNNQKSSFEVVHLSVLIGDLRIPLFSCCEGSYVIMAFHCFHYVITSIHAILALCVMTPFNARWLTIHWFDLWNLKATFPDVFEYFSKGFFSFQKSNREFSRMGLDQVHGQNNAVIKGCGGATDIVNKVDDSTLIRWETCGPDIARLILEFENSIESDPQPGVARAKHHEDNTSFQKKSILCKGFAINPFLQDKLSKMNNPKVLIPDI